MPADMCETTCKADRASQVKEAMNILSDKLEQLTHQIDLIDDRLIDVTVQVPPNVEKSPEPARVQSVKLAETLQDYSRILSVSIQRIISLRERIEV